MTRSLSFIGFALLVVLTAPNAPAGAAQLQLHLQYDESYKADFSPAGYALVDGNQTAPFGSILPTDVHQFSILLEVIGAQNSPELPEESLAIAIMDVSVGAGVAPYSPVTYNPAFPNPIFDPPGPPAPRGLWTVNEDAGADELHIHYRQFGRPRIGPGRDHTH